MTLTPSFARSTVHVAIPFLFVTAYSAYRNHSSSGHWWPQPYVVSLAIPFIVIVIIVWIAFVPRRIELTDHRLEFVRFWGSTAAIPLRELEYYMQSPTTFMIQRAGESAYQIYPGAFSRRDWRDFVGTLEREYPERQASYSVGTTLFGNQ